MALSKENLKADIVILLNAIKEAESQSDAIDQFATGLSNAIDTYVKGATIIADPGQVSIAAMVAGTYAVVMPPSNILESTIN